ncbi:MAG: hypothetical protein HQL69_10345 [Magnetococcales bacterium]|nr:hypothetical protein [Magnetococcales bacterium]
MIKFLCKRVTLFVSPILFFLSLPIVSAVYATEEVKIIQAEKKSDVSDKFIQIADGGNTISTIANNTETASVTTTASTSAAATTTAASTGMSTLKWIGIGAVAIGGGAAAAIGGGSSDSSSSTTSTDSSTTTDVTTSSSTTDSTTSSSTTDSTTSSSTTDSTTSSTSTAVSTSTTSEEASTQNCYYGYNVYHPISSAYLFCMQKTIEIPQANSCSQIGSPNYTNYKWGDGSACPGGYDLRCRKTESGTLYYDSTAATTETEEYFFYNNYTSYCVHGGDPF